MIETKYLILVIVSLTFSAITQRCLADDDEGEILPSFTVDGSIDGVGKDEATTDDHAPLVEEEQVKLDGLNAAQLRELKEQAETFTFQAEVNRMMKLIINSLYRNKEIFLRELISNASDALDKIRLLALSNINLLDATNELSIRIKVNKESRMLHITDTGIGMTRDDLVKNLGTIAKSGTAEFLSNLNTGDGQDKNVNDMIGQFGVGFYSAFLVADKVLVTTKHNDDKQYIWESDANSFSIVEDPRGPSLKRGTQISLQLKEEAIDNLEIDTLKNLVKKYSQFINFPIYIWSSTTETVQEPIEEDEQTEHTEIEEKSEDDDAAVEDAKEEEKPKTKDVVKTIWDWEILNNHKPIWTRKPDEVEDNEYKEFYKALTKDTREPLSHTHFNAEGEVSFKSLLYVPPGQPSDSFNKYGTVTDNIKLYVRRVFITDEFTDLLPKYLSFLQGIVDSDDLPLNVSREVLQQHKLLKIIKKKLIRKALDMLKKLDEESYKKFWAEYSTNIKLGIIEDPSNRARLAKLVRFQSSIEKTPTSLAEYVKRMKENQEHIYYIAGSSRAELERSPFVEGIIRKGYEVLYLIEAVDEYTLSAIPEFEGKKFQNVAKEGVSLAENKEKAEELKSQFEPLTKWLGDNALKDQISKAVVSDRLADSPCALVAGMFGWTGNMERLALSNAHQKADDPQREFYLKQRKSLEINPRHPLIKDLLRRVQDDAEDQKAKDIAVMLFRTATLRSGFMLQESADFAESIEALMRQSLGIPLDEKVSYEDEEPVTDQQVDEEEEEEEEEKEFPEHEEL